MYTVVFGAEVVMDDEASLLSREHQREMLRVLESSPRTCKPLQGLLRGHYRWRCSDVRVVFRVDEPSATVTVIAIGKRRDAEVYATAQRRVT